MSGNASGGSDEAKQIEDRAQDVLTLPAPDPHHTVISLQSSTTDVVPRGNALRRRRRDSDEELEGLRRQLEETHAREVYLEMAMTERAAAFAMRERSETRAVLEAMQSEANASVARVEEVALGYEQQAQNLLLEDQVRIARIREIEHAVQTELASQQAMMVESVSGREHALAEREAMNLQEKHAMRDDRDRQVAEA